MNEHLEVRKYGQGTVYLRLAGLKCRGVGEMEIEFIIEKNGRGWQNRRWEDREFHPEGRGAHCLLL